MSDVFISYAHSTAKQAQAVAEGLRLLGHAVWIDDELPAHRAYTDVIEERLKAAKAVVVVWSAEAAKSHWVRAEANTALEAGTLVQLTVDGAMPPMPFGQIQCADLSGWSGDSDAAGWRKVVASTAELLGAAARTSLPLVVATPRPPANAPTTAAPERYTNNLPKRLGALIGRETEMSELASLLGEADLVTITGTGGVGKTRIAIEVGVSQLNDYEDGVWLAELAPVSDPEQVPGAIARAMSINLPAAEDQLTALVDRLRLRRCLIILDNCEHVIDAVASLAGMVLDTSTGVKMLASSQELLGIEGEQVYRLRSLEVQDAAALFAERAHAADVLFKITAQAADTVTAICQRLDGIPLAIEMAAARAPSLGCEGVLRRLDDRFRVLTGGRRTALPRQRTLLATLDWSHGLLSEIDATVFRRLSIFTGGFSLEAASEVAADAEIDGYAAMDALSSLVAKSLVVADPGEHGPRYRLLETTRAYALEKLDAAAETLATQRRHAEYVLKLVTPMLSEYWGNASDDAIAARYYADLDNIDRALDWAFGPTGDADLGIAIVAATPWLWGIRSLFPEYIRWVEVAAARLSPTTPEAVLGGFLVARASVYMMTNQGKAIGLVDEAIEAARALGDPVVLAGALNAKGITLVLTGRAADAQVVSDESLALTAGFPASRLTGQTQYLAGLVVLTLQGEAAAHPVFDSLVAELRSIGADGLANFFTINGATSLLPRDTPDVAIPALRELLGRIRPTEMFSGLSTGNAAMILMSALSTRNAAGDLEEAMSVARTYQKAAGRSLAYGYFGVLAQIEVKSRRPRNAAKLWAYADTLRAAAGVEWSVSSERFEVTLALIRAELSEGEIAALQAEGAKMSVDEAFQLAMGAG